MALNKLSYELFPDVQYNGETYSTDLDGKLPPLSVLFKSEFLDKNKSKFKLFVLGAASLGKSSMLKTLRLDLLGWGVPFFSYDLKDLNNSAPALDGFIREINGLPKSMLIILDGYDELYDEQAATVVDRLIFNTENPIIVASRHGKPVKRIKVANGNITDERRHENSDEVIELFGEYAQVEINQLTDSRVNEILSQHDIIVKRGVKELLRTTMFMSMLLTLDKSRPMEWGDIDNDTEFMTLYFSELFKDKNTGNLSATQVLSGIGKEIYLASAPQKRDLPEIPTELNSIFYIKKDGEKQKIESDQIRFSNYAVSVYLCKQIKDLYDINRINDAAVVALLEYRINNDTLIGIGRLIKKMPNGKEIIKLFNDRCTKAVSRTYYNIVCIFTGYNNGVLNDIDQNKIFDLGKYVRKTTENYGFFTDNRGLTEINSKYFTKINSIGRGCRFKITLGDWVKSIPSHAFSYVDSCISEISIGKNVKKIGHNAFGYTISTLKYRNRELYEDMDWIEKISVNKDNKFFYEKDGCLIDRKKKTVILTAYRMTIPKGVIAIECALIHNTIRIPDSVQFISSCNAWFGIDEQGRYIVPIRYLKRFCEMNIYLGEYAREEDEGPLVKEHTDNLCGIDIYTMDRKTRKAFKYIQRTNKSKKIHHTLSLFKCVGSYIVGILSIYISAKCGHLHKKIYYPSLRNWYYFKRLRALMLLQEWLFNYERNILIHSFIRMV